ncbi:hypothetical protein BJX64DRAFT_257293 [Aspergillus heterothallicus]
MSDPGEPGPPAADTNELPSLTRGHQPSQRASICRYLLLGWSHTEASKEVRASKRSVERAQHNLLLYGSVRKPRYCKLGRAKKLSQADEDALLTRAMAAASRACSVVV